MDFDYKTNFKIDKVKQKYIDNELKTKKFFYNEDGVIVSKEYSKREAGHSYYSKDWKKQKNTGKFHAYKKSMMGLCERYYPSSNNPLEVGGGCGTWAEAFINKFNPDNYTVYEFSSSIEEIKKRVKGLSANVTIRNKTFRDISSKELEKYDCVMALEVLEHINWDREFLSKIKSGTWVFISVPVPQAKTEHVRAYLTPDSVAYRYDMLKIHEIKGVLRSKKSIRKWNHYYPLFWSVVAQRV